MYKLVNLSKYYNSDNKVNKALDNISLEIKQNEFVMISGPSGSGKSTLLNVLSGIDSYQDGEMFFNNKETSYYDEKDYEQFRYENISFVFQEYNLIESYTCYENIEVALISKNISFTHDDVIKILKKVNLEDKEKVKAAKLSGGQKARLAIARALAFNSRILVLDEPTGALDSKSSIEVVNILKELKGYKTIIVVTHNEELFKDIANHHIKIIDGKVKEDKIISDTKSLEINENSVDKKYNKEGKLALLNIKNQPKKSILSFSLCFVLTLFIFLIISNLSFMSKPDDKSVTIRSSYDRVMIGNNEGLTSEDISSLSNGSYKVIIENTLLQANIGASGFSLHDRYYDGGLSIDNLEKENLKIGVLPNKENEIIIPYDQNIYNSWDHYNGKNISLSITLNNDNKSINYKGKVVGMSNDEFYYFYDASNLDIILANLFKDRLVFEHSGVPNIKIDYTLNDNKIHSNVNLKLFLDGNEYSDVVINQETSDYIVPTIISHPDTLANLFNNKRYNISIYTKDIDKYIHSIDNKYEYMVPNVKFDEYDFNRLMVTFLSVFMAGLIYLLVFLTNFITKQIYRYKNKDNAILNSLGFTTNTLKKSLAIELVFNYIVSLLIMIILAILDVTTSCFNGFFSYNNFYSYLVLLIVISLTIYSGIKNVFKMFNNNSLYKKLRGGDLDA